MTESTELAVVEQPQPRRQLVAGGRPSAIVPQSMEDAYRLAKAVSEAGLAPKGLDTPGKCLIAIMHGLELGLTPMMAIQRIAIVGNRPAIWGDAVIGLVEASGLSKYIKEWIEGEGDAMVAHCETWRVGKPEAQTTTFSVAQAKEGGLWGKDIWQKNKKRMLQMRARAFRLRDTYSDVLGGLYIAEELQGTDVDTEVERVKPPAPPKREPVAAIENKPAVAMDTANVIEGTAVEVKIDDTAAKEVVAQHRAAAATEPQETKPAEQAQSPRRPPPPPPRAAAAKPAAKVEPVAEQSTDEHDAPGEQVTWDDEQQQAA